MYREFLSQNEKLKQADTDKLDEWEEVHQNQFRQCFIHVCNATMSPAKLIVTTSSSLGGE